MKHLGPQARAAEEELGNKASRAQFRTQKFQSVTADPIKGALQLCLSELV